MRPGHPSEVNSGGCQDSESPFEVHPAKREFGFLLACIRSFFRRETELPPTIGLDWLKLLQLAQRHSVLALFCQAVGGCQDIPVEVVSYVRKRAMEAARFDLTLNAELARLLELFVAHKIQVVPLKGPVLGQTLYVDTALRSSSDLDLLVQPKDVTRARQLLEGKGYRLESVLHWPVESAYLRCRDSQLSFVPATSEPADAVCIDLHWRLLPGYFPPAFDDRQVWASLRKVAVAGTFASTLSLEHLVLFLCAHGTKHLWERLGWICDIARLVQLETAIDWAQVFNQARETDTSRMVVLGLLLASELLGVDPPPEAVEYAGEDPTACVLARIVVRRMQDEIGTPPSAVESALFSCRAFERTRHRVRLLIGIFVEPTEAEYQALKLPPSLHWLYYLFRPLRLMAKYAREPRKRKPGAVTRATSAVLPLKSD